MVLTISRIADSVEALMQFGYDSKKGHRYSMSRRVVRIVLNGLRDELLATGQTKIPGVGTLKLGKPYWHHKTNPPRMVRRMRFLPLTELKRIQDDGNSDTN